jgi:hypothetical protein
MLQQKLQAEKKNAEDEASTIISDQNVQIN